MKRLGFHTLRDKATDTLGDKLSRQLQEDVAPKMSDEEAFSLPDSTPRTRSGAAIPIIPTEIHPPCVFPE